jgi:hypothetical protein
MIKTNATRKYRKVLSITLASLLLATSFPVNGGTSLAKSAPETLAAAAQFDIGSSLPFPFNGALPAPASAFPTMAAAQGSNFVYVISSFHAFGNECIPSSTCNGPFREYTFNLPPNATTGSGHIMLQASHVDVDCNTFTINGRQISVLNDRNGSTSAQVEMNDIPSGVLRPGANRLFIQARDVNCSVNGQLDDFRVSNVVIFYRTQ